MATVQKLARNVTVDGRTYGPDDDVPAEVAEKIRNPKAWLQAETADDQSAKGPAGTADGRRLASAVAVGGRTYGPDDFVPDDVADQIRNPKAWLQAEAETADSSEADAGAGPETAAKAAKKPSKAAADKG